MRILLYLAIGLAIGSLSGALGIGGGVLLVPALIWLCKFDITKAAGTSLAVLVPPIGLPAAWKFYVEKRIDLDAAFWIAAAFAVGAYFSAAMVHQIPQQTLRSAFGFIMIYIAMRFIIVSDSEANYAAAGLISVAVAWLSNAGLRACGRRHLTRPHLGRKIRALKRDRHPICEYQI
jgi:uncharacterized membrane protein YfcA